MTDKLREMMNDGLEAACDLQNWIENTVDETTFEKIPVDIWNRITHAVSAKRAALAAAPQPAPEREALVALLRSALPVWTGQDGARKGKSLWDCQTDALLARGLRLSGDETMAWGIVRKDGEIIAGGLRNKEAASNFAHEGERVVRVAFRVVEGCDDAA